VKNIFGQQKEAALLCFSFADYSISACRDLCQAHVKPALKTEKD